MLIYLKGRKKNKDSPSSVLFLNAITRIGSTQNLEPGTQLKPLKWAAGTQLFEPSPATFHRSQWKLKPDSTWTQELPQDVRIPREFLTSVPNACPIISTKGVGD